MSSIYQNCEREIVARNIVTILAREGDTWRQLDEKTYVKHRKKDGEWSEGERFIFQEIVGDITSFIDAVALSPSWARVAKAAQKAFAAQGPLQSAEQRAGVA